MSRMTGQTYYTAMEDAMVDAAEESLRSTDKTHAQMLSDIDDISEELKHGLPDSVRIILTAQRHTLRLRLQRVEEVARRLLGK